MGWSSGTDIFDAAVKAILAGDSSKKAIGRLYDAMKDQDWDTECESAYWDHPVIGPIIGNDGKE